MSIKIKDTTGVIPILTTDTVILEVSGRVGIESMYVFNAQLTHQISVGFYISPDLTTASSKWVEAYTIQPGEGIDINGLIGQAYEENNNILALADYTGLNCTTAYTQFSGTDV